MEFRLIYVFIKKFSLWLETLKQKKIILKLVRAQTRLLIIFLTVLKTIIFNDFQTIIP